MLTKTKGTKFQEEPREELINSAVDDEMTSPEVSEESGSFKTRNFVIGTVIGVVGILIVLGAVMSLMYYKAPDKYPILDKIAQKLNLPIASVDGQFISRADFDRDYATLKYFYAQQIKAGAQAAQIPSDSQTKKDVEDQLVNKILVDKLAKSYGLVISDIEVEAYWKKDVVSSFADEAAAIQKIKEFYNMTPEEFKDRVLRSNLLYDKVSQAMIADQKIQEKVKQKADEVLAKVQEGKTDFAELAKQYSEDTGSKDTGGDLGWFGRGAMVKPFEDAAFALKKGETSGLVTTDYGFHIIKVLDKRGAAGDTKNPEEVKASHILIQYVSLKSYLEEMQKTASVKLYVQFN